MRKDNSKHKTTNSTNTVLSVVSYECTFCYNYWTLEEGFRVDTNQCAGCQQWDDDKPKRDKERENFRKIDFPYVAGDPFW